jgi:phenylpyruvate tautomerase PptA (4-oxalocrotonate tautomerase family)
VEADMPQLDAYIPAGALSPDAERDLFAKVTDLLIRHEGADPTNETVRSIAWVFVHRPEAVYVGGRPAEVPRYRFVASVPEGQFNAERRQAIVEAITEAVLDAEQGAYPRDPMRVWVFTPEVPDGTWGGAGRIVTLGDIAGMALGDLEAGHAYAERVFAERRGQSAPVAG